jgi:gluconate 2-dehydrogenase gamma chain
MGEINRREVLQIMGATSALAFTWTEAEAEQAAEKAKQARKQAAASKQPYKPQFFTPHEYATVVMLADIIIPKDERSGSASEAGAPQFIDYIVGQQTERQTALRGGLAWLDTECRRRFDKSFIDCTDAQRSQVLDDVAWPAKARPEMSHGVRFFNTIRDLVATGFWSSKMGVEDLGYQGNTFVAEWTGAPEPVLKKLGVSYDTP